MTVRCTQKLLKAMRVPPRSLPDANPAPDDWYANLLWFDRRKCLLVTHADTLFPIFIADVLAADLRDLAELVRRNAQVALYDEHLPPDALGDLTTPLELARTASRRILGVMTDDAYGCEAAVAHAGGLERLDTLDLNRRLRRTLHSGPNGYERPLDAVRARLRD